MTWCVQCGFRYADVAEDRIAGWLRDVGERFAAELRGGDDALRVRPAEGVWSALEYACHVRDVLLVQRDRALLTLVEDRPSFARMYRDERVTLARYGAHSPRVVAEQLLMAAELAATVFGGLSGSQWRRRFVYNWPEATERDLVWLGRHTVHECEHHFADAREGVASLR